MTTYAVNVQQEQIYTNIAFNAKNLTLPHN